MVSAVVSWCCAGRHVNIHLHSVLLIVGVIILAFIVGISYMHFIDFNFILAWCHINVVDLMDFSVIEALFRDDPWFEICCFLEGCLQSFW